MPRPVVRRGKIVVDLTEEEARLRIARGRARLIDSEPARRLGRVVVRRHPDEIVVGGPLLEEQIPGVRRALRIVAAADGAVLVEDLSLDAIERARVERHGIAARRRGIADHPQAVPIGDAVPRHEVRLGGDAEKLLAATACVVGERPVDEHMQVDDGRAVVGGVTVDVDAVGDDVLERLELGIEVGVAVVERVIDDDRVDTRARAARVERAVAARADRQDADAVHGTVAVAGVAVRAAEMARVARRGVRSRPEDEEAVVPNPTAPADDDRGGGRGGGRGLRFRRQRGDEPTSQEQRAEPRHGDRRCF